MRHVWWREEVHTGFWRRNHSERDHLQDLGLDGGANITTCLKEIGWEGDDYDKWWFLVKLIMNHRVP